VGQLVRQVVGNRRGQGLIEYVLIVTLIGCCLVAILGLASTATRNMYNRTSSTISRQTSASGYGSGGGGGAPGGWSGSGVGTPAAESPPPEDEPTDDDPSDSTAVQASHKS
jgi:Flp pilus assembly pilin Flp